MYNITVSTIISVAASLEFGRLVYHGNVDVYMSVSVKCFIYIVYLLVNKKYQFYNFSTEFVQKP